MFSNNTKISTLADIEAIISNPEPRDIRFAKYPVITHDASGLTLRVVPMGGKSYRLWYHMQAICAKDWRDVEMQKRTDKFLLLNAVVAEGSEPLTDELAEQLLDGDYGGKDTADLLEAAASQNPPRESRIEARSPEVMAAYGFSRAMIVLVQELQAAGLFELLRERKANAKEHSDEPSSDDESPDALSIWEATLPLWEDALDAEGAAFQIGISREVGGDSGG